MSKGIFTALTIVLVCRAIQGENNAKELIINKDLELKSAINRFNRAQTPANREKIITVINGVFDFYHMGHQALPTEVWNAADSTLRNIFIFQFKRMIENSSINKLEFYQSDSIFYDLEETDEKSAIVSARLWRKGRYTLLHYKMIKSDKIWKVWDLVIDDLSTVRNYRDQFKIILESKTLKELVTILKRKADSYEGQ